MDTPPGTPLPVTVDAQGRVILPKEITGRHGLALLSGLLRLVNRRYVQSMATAHQAPS